MPGTLDCRWSLETFRDFGTHFGFGSLHRKLFATWQSVFVSWERHKGWYERNINEDWCVTFPRFTLYNFEQKERVISLSHQFWGCEMFVLGSVPPTTNIDLHKWWFLIGISYFQESIFSCHVQCEQWKKPCLFRVYREFYHPAMCRLE